MPNQRFLSLDVFRGMTICLMIIVNTPGDPSLTFAPFLHASWHGFTPTDLVFPSFLFAVGNSLSFTEPTWAKLNNSTVLLKIGKRTVESYRIRIMDKSGAKSLAGIITYAAGYLPKN